MKRHSLEFKKAVLAELASGTSTAAQICRKYEIASGLLYYWKRRSENGKLDERERNQEMKVKGLEKRVEDLERMVGQLTMENQILKKAREKFLEQASKKGSSLPLTVPKDALSNGSAK